MIDAKGCFGDARLMGRGTKLMSAYRYEVDVKPLADELGGGWVAIVPELPGCKSDGDTPTEALSNAFDAIQCWIEAAVEMGRAVPEPKVVPTA